MLLVTSLLPRAAMPFETWQQIAVLAFFFLLMAVLYVQANLMALNPLLLLMGYHLYEISVEGVERRYSYLPRR